MEQEGDEQTDSPLVPFPPLLLPPRQVIEDWPPCFLSRKHGSGPRKTEPQPLSGVLPAEPSSTQQGSLVFMLRLDLVYKAAGPAAWRLGAVSRNSYILILENIFPPRTPPNLILLILGVLVSSGTLPRSP